MNVIAELHAVGALSDADVQVAQALGRLTGDATLPVALAAALTVRAVRYGHVCLDLARVYDVGITDAEDNRVDLDLPELKQWRTQLAASPAVRTPEDEDRTPLVLTGERVYLDRYWQYERRCAAMLRSRAGVVPAADDPSAIDEVVAAASNDADQRRAVASALTRRLTVLTGGPGTGKTTTIVQILTALLRIDPELAGRMVLAAPTGKAAARMAEAIRQDRDLAKASGQGQDTERDALSAIEAVTLHRLLGFNPANPTRFRHNATNPLDYDVIVVDEASMVSLPMMTKLLDALPTQARLLLVGDREQLASIDAGAVLADISTPPDTQPASGDGPTDLKRPEVIALQRNYRFAADSGVGAIADALRTGQRPQTITALLTEAGAAGSTNLVAPVPHTVALLPASVASRAITHYTELAQLARDNADPARLLTHLDGFRVLAALRRGRGGVEQINTMITAAVHAELPDAAGPEYADLAAAGPWPIGTPVMVTHNDYALELFNGDVGVVVHDPAEPRRRAVVFATGHGAMRYVPLVRLTNLEAVYAMSVHKSQGSQFDSVVVTLGMIDSPLLTRELIYTGITRARRDVTVVADESVFEAALARRVQRASGLRSLVFS